jgi:thermitase
VNKKKLGIPLFLMLVSIMAYYGINISPAASANNDNASSISSQEVLSAPQASYDTQRWGVNYASLAQKVIARINFSDSPTDDDLHGHGTHMAGTIVAIAPQCQLMSIKVADDAGRCQAQWVAQGIIWATDHGADIINLSLCTKPSTQMQQAIKYAWQNGVAIIAAAGNQGTSTLTYPAYYTSCIAVAAVNENNSLALLSNHGSWVDVSAPGDKIYSQLPQGKYGYKSGTSPAAAHVSGVAALLYNITEDTNNNGAINDEVRQAIENSCSAIGTNGTGEGIINAAAAVALATS